ncbi:protein of unknown function [Pararobbsia alpina]|jgi:hypothetical protein|uniref:hypothetical protein n=1 Tax=Pararobbsia alpina TaxID=621374 RepID=UPI0039A53AF4
MLKPLSRWDMQHVAAATLCASVFITVVALPSTSAGHQCRRVAGHGCNTEVKPVKSVNDKPRASFWA